MMFTPLMHREMSVGHITVTRKEPGKFAPHHVQLLQTFADQAVIAIQNARPLFFFFFFFFKKKFCNSRPRPPTC